MFFGNIRVPVDDHDRSIIDDLAQRQVDAQADGDHPDDNPTTFKSFNSQLKIHQVGWAGEYAFAKWYGLERPQVSDEYLRAGDAGFDFLLGYRGEEYRVDVKTTANKHNGMMKPHDQAIQADIYYLCFATEGYVKIRGYCTAEELEAAQVKRNLPYPARVIPKYQLHDPWDRDEITELDADAKIGDSEWSGMRGPG